MRSMLTAACALALGIAWSAAPAIAQDTTKEKAENKAERAWDKTKATTKEAWDKTKEKTEGAWDKTKEKTGEMTGKVKDKMSGHGAGREARMSGEVRSAQQALQEKGFDPGPIDGVMGAKTTAAIKDFQQKNNLTVTGTLNADTRDRLMASSPPSASPGTEPSRSGAPKK
jgi:peptidoglycan hydrolase-like protein with peptidoglycan-binding domain